MALIESAKKELALSLNAFEKPTELSGKNAWISLVTKLLFLIPGTYPSIPLMGIGLQTYDYALLDDIKGPLQEKIMSQVQTYLPEVPLKNVTVDSTEVSGKVALLIILEFDGLGISDIAVVATSQVNNIIDFEVSI